MNLDKNKGCYPISVVANMFNIHQQSLRLFEKENLIVPGRTSGGTRIYSAGDLDTIKDILHLTIDLKINLAGVRYIFRLRNENDDRA